jgi:transposase
MGGYLLQWMHFNPKGTEICCVKQQVAQNSNWTAQPLGRPKIITEEYMAVLQELVQHSPREYGYPFQRWTAAWLRCHLAKKLGIEVSDRHVNRLLSQMGLSKRKMPAAIADDGLASQSRCISIKDLDPENNSDDWPLN